MIQIRDHTATTMVEAGLLLCGPAPAWWAAMMKDCQPDNNPVWKIDKNINVDDDDRGENGSRILFEKVVPNYQSYWRGQLKSFKNGCIIVISYPAKTELYTFLSIHNSYAEHLWLEKCTKCSPSNVKVPPVILMGYQEGCYVLISNHYLLKLTTLIFGRLPVYLLI